MKHLGDITRLNGAEIEPVDVVTGGSPCQDLSLAGKRAGLSGDRSGLFHEQMRLVREMREATGGVYPRFMVWENVSGALSTNKGTDFREVLNACVKVVEEAAAYVPMPEKGGWAKAGVLYDEMGRWSIAWRIHDAQFWGVAQRRRRIALVCDFGGMSAPEVLFEREGVRGDTAPCGAAGQGAAGNPGGSSAKADAGRIAYPLVGVNSNSMKSSNPHSGCYETEAAGTIMANGYEPNNQGGTCIVGCRVYDARGNGNGSTAATLAGDHESCVTDYTNVVVHRDEPYILESNQNHATITNSGVCPTLPASMGLGGGYVPMVTEESFSINGDAHESGVSVMSEVSHASKTTTKESVFVKSVSENSRNEVRLGDIASSLATGGEKPGRSYPCICIGNGQAHVTEHYTEEVSQTLNCMHDPMTILEPRAYQLVGVNSNSMKSSNPNSGCYETEQAGTITTNGCVPNNQGGTAIMEPVNNSKVYGICSYSTNRMKSSNPHSGVYEAETSKTLDTVSCGNPVCCQGGMAVVDQSPFIVDRAAFNQGKNAQFDIKIEKSEVVASMVARGPHAVAQPVQYRVRRLTPLECTRLQGYPDGWVDIGDWIDSKGKKHKEADAPKYKALGNSIALPFWKWLLARIYAECESPHPTLGSLFDGIGGFPLSWPGRTVWSSEIDEFSLAVLRARFGEERAARQLALPF